MEVVKSRLQRGGDGTSATALLKRIWRDEGYRGVFRVRPPLPSSSIRA